MNWKFGEDLIILTERDNEVKAVKNMIKNLEFPLLRISDRKSSLFQHCQKLVNDYEGNNITKVSTVYVTYKMDACEA